MKHQTLESKVMEIIKDFLPKEKQDEIEKILIDNFPWYYSREATYDMFGDHRTLNTSFFAHMFYANGSINSNYYNSVCLPVIQGLERYKGQVLQDKIWRIKANLYTKDGSYPEDFHHPPHIDNMDDNFRGQTFLYFVNDADGDTFMFNEHYNYDTKKYGDENFTGNFSNKLRIFPEKGKGVLFNLTQSHTSSVPRKGGVRITLNFVFGEYIS